MKMRGLSCIFKLRRRRRRFFPPPSSPTTAAYEWGNVSLSSVQACVCVCARSGACGQDSDHIVRVESWLELVSDVDLPPPPKPKSVSDSSFDPI